MRAMNLGGVSWHLSCSAVLRSPVVERSEGRQEQGAWPHRIAHGGPVLDKKRTVVLLRSVVVISTSYLILFGEAPVGGLSIAYIIALIFSNAALLRTPKAWFRKPSFSAVLLLGDTAAVLVGLYLTVGCFSQDFLIIYFFTIFLTTATQGVAQIAMGSAMVSGLYGYWLWISTPHALVAGEWLRLPFFFIVAVFYAYMTEETKHERWRRLQAERRSDHLRFLLTIGDTLSQPAVSWGAVQQLGGLIEAAFPRLACAMLPTPPGPPPRAGVWLPLGAHGETFGSLRVTTRDGGPLDPDEQQFCRLVALAAANTLYTDKQVMAAGESLRVKEQFLATLSHELRTPLHAILGYTDILDSLAGDTRNPLARESLDRLRANACRLQDLLEEILGLAALRAGAPAVETERVNLHEIFAQFAESLRTQLAGRPISFEWEIGPGIPIVRSDARKIRQILSGLLSNAVKFTEKGLISLRARRIADDHFELAVRDTGIGMAPEDLDRIFEDFHQLDGSMTRRFEGLGVGLALVRALTTALGGRVDVESQPYAGSVFRVRLPLRGAATKVGAAAAPTAGLAAVTPCVG
jgi:signal transduction histidine kinase